MVLNGAGAVTRFPVGGDLRGNARDFARINFGGFGAEAGVFHDLGIPYERDGNWLQGGGDITFEAGVVVKVNAAAAWAFGWAGGGGVVNVAGTASRPVVFEAKTAAPGTWRGVTFESTVAQTSALRHLVVRHAGASGYYPLNVATRILVEDVLLEQNETGLFIDQSGLAAGSRDVTVRTTNGPAALIHPNALASFPVGGTYTGNAQDVIEVAQGYYGARGVAPVPGVPYVLQGWLAMTEGSSLDLSPGVEFVFDPGGYIEVGWNGGNATFKAIGTADAKVRFSASDPVAGSWRGILVRGSAFSSSSLAHCVLTHGGYAGAAGLELAKEISVTNTTISGSAGYAIQHPNAFTTDYSLTNTLTGNAQGTIPEVLSGPGDPGRGAPPCARGSARETLPGCVFAVSPPAPSS